MEKNTKNPPIVSNSRLTLENQKKITLSGVMEVVSSNESSIVAKLNKSNVYITGSNIHITKLDVEQGVLEADGLFNQIKYNQKPENLIKRIFKWFF